MALLYHSSRVHPVRKQQVEGKVLGKGVCYAMVDHLHSIIHIRLAIAMLYLKHRGVPYSGKFSQAEIFINIRPSSLIL